MYRLCSLSVLLIGLVAGAAQAQNRQPVQPTRRNPTERISPMPGVTLPAGVSQRNAEPVAVPTQVQPNGTLPLPSIPSGNVTAGPIDSVQVQQPSNSRPATPTRTRARTRTTRP
ncbi:hypothetical protein [Hymenobacter mucosus]|uniref:Uncharacterized protein n=1 Tax=Hymenobacter mucosus TaxID=1411120 RepID=A0A238WXC7_9BACT|nr:hypothetical protein [Hymenobacter mucosus]SNR51146.1 hypothetical protein SAMN06269173_103226 [Hymenobacter mucosus]